MDEVELQYEQAIAQASARGDNDQAFDLGNGLEEYRRCYKFDD